MCIATLIFYSHNTQQLFGEHEEHMSHLKNTTRQAKGLLVNKHKGLEKLWFEAQQVSLIHKFK